jgi:hypothetical protein
MLPFTMECSPYAGSVMACTCVSLIELLLWMVMGWVPALKYMLSGVRQLLRAFIVAMFIWRAEAPK